MLSWIGAAVLVVLLAIWFSRCPIAGLYTFMGSIPLSYKIAFQGTSFYFLTELVLIPFVLGVWLAHGKDLRSLRMSPWLALVPFVGFLAVSAMWAIDFPAVAKEVVRWGEFVLAGVATSFLITRRTGFAKPVVFLGWIGAVVSVVGTTQFLLRINQNIYRPGAAAFFGHPNPTAAFLSLCIIPLLGLLVQERGNRLMRRMLAFLMLLLGLAFTFSRGVLLSSAMGGVLFLYFLGRSRPSWNRRSAALLVGTLVTLVGLLIVPRFRATAVGRFIAQPLFEERQSILALGWSLYREHPWIGLGAGNLKPYAAKSDLHVQGAVPFQPNVGDLHNLFLQLAVETGSVGLILFLGGILSFFAVLVRRRRYLDPSSEALFWALSAASLAYLAANMTGVYTIKGIHLEWAVLLGLLTAMAERDKPLDA